MGCRNAEKPCGVNTRRADREQLSQGMIKKGGCGD